MKQLMPISPGGMRLQFIQLPGLPEVTTAQQAGQYFNKSPKYIGQVIMRNPHLFKYWARRATDGETEDLKLQNATLKIETRRANPYLITFEGMMLLASSIKNPEATQTLLNWATATGRIRQQQSLLLQEQIEGDAPMEQIAQTIAHDKPPKPRKRAGAKVTCDLDIPLHDWLLKFATNKDMTKAEATRQIIRDRRAQEESATM